MYIYFQFRKLKIFLLLESALHKIMHCFTQKIKIGDFASAKHIYYNSDYYSKSDTTA